MLKVYLQSTRLCPSSCHRRPAAVVRLSGILTVHPPLSVVMSQNTCSCCPSVGYTYCPPSPVRRHVTEDLQLLSVCRVYLLSTLPCPSSCHRRPAAAVRLSGILTVHPPLSVCPVYRILTVHPPLSVVMSQKTCSCCPSVGYTVYLLSTLPCPSSCHKRPAAVVRLSGIPYTYCPPSPVRRHVTEDLELLSVCRVYRILTVHPPLSVVMSQKTWSCCPSVGYIVYLLSTLPCPSSCHKRPGAAVRLSGISYTLRLFGAHASSEPCSRLDSFPFANILKRIYDNVYLSSQSIDLAWALHII